MDPYQRLRAVVERLRAPNGCDWDRAQTPASMRAYLVEEAFEVLDAVDAGDDHALRTELGDLAFVIASVARMREEAGAFGLDDVLSAAADKMEERHPHLFGAATEAPAWESFKRDQQGRGSLLDGIPKALPALLRAQRVSERVAEVGFDWPDTSGVRAKVSEELAELDEAVEQGSAEAVAEELGDLFFALTSLARHHGLRAEDVTRAATAKFERRFRTVEGLAQVEGIDLASSHAQTLDALWVRAKGEAP